MTRLGMALFFVLAAAADAWAQEGITQPLPDSEIRKNELTLGADLLIGYNTDLDIALFGASGQMFFGISDQVGANGKLTFLVGDDYSLFTIGGAVAVELIQPTAATDPSLTFFGGLGLAVVHVDIGRDDFTDTDGYFELGIQADLYASPELRFVPFFGLTVVFGEGSDVIVGLGGKVQYALDPTWRVEGGIIGQFGEISDSILFLIGFVKEFK